MGNYKYLLLYNDEHGWYEVIDKSFCSKISKNDGVETCIATLDNTKFLCEVLKKGTQVNMNAEFNMIVARTRGSSTQREADKENTVNLMVVESANMQHLMAELNKTNSKPSGMAQRDNHINGNSFSFNLKLLNQAFKLII